MAKQKTKKLLFDTTATETSPGVWSWEVKGFKWEYRDLWLLGNPHRDVEDSELPFSGERIAFFKTLELAVSYTLGYNSGYDQGYEAANDQADEG